MRLIKEHTDKIRSAVAEFLGPSAVNDIHNFIDIPLKLFNLLSYFYAWLYNKQVIHVIGDSHTNKFRYKLLFIVHHLGAATAFNLGEPQSTSNSNRKLFKILKKIKSERISVLLVFGEIDCRVHIYNQYQKKNNVPITDLIDIAVEKYCDVLGHLSKRRFNFFIHGIPPATKQGNYYNYPTYAEPDVHKVIYKAFNERLKRKCEENNFNYIDIYPYVSDENGFIADKYNADDVHLTKNTVEFFKEILKNKYNLLL